VEAGPERLRDLAVEGAVALAELDRAVAGVQEAMNLPVGMSGAA
jgi:hypothetical protein